MDLASIAPPEPERVRVGGRDYLLRGVSMRDVNALSTRFPTFLEELKTGLSVDAAMAFLAASAGHPGSAEHEAFFDALPAGQQFDLLQRAMRKTFGPFDEPSATASPDGSSSSETKSAAPADNPIQGAT